MEILVKEEALEKLKWDKIIYGFVAKDLSQEKLAELEGKGYKKHNFPNDEFDIRRMIDAMCEIRKLKKREEIVDDEDVGDDLGYAILR